jgi:aspartate/methionine/tyrosine aminotransferase
VVIAYCLFCEEHNLHLISDEVYALSVFPSRDNPHPNPFVSALSIDLESFGVTPSRVHVLYGMSKDFNANGFHAGALVSQSNPSIIQSIMASAPFMLVASPSDSLWSTLLNDQIYLPVFIKTNQLKLREAYEHMTSWLKFHNIPYIPSSAGLFLMVDWRPILSDFDRYGSILSITPDQSMRERESTLFAFLLARKVMAIPGAMCHMAEPGWFRFTFSVRRDYLDVALARIETALEWETWPLLSASEKPLAADHPLAGDTARAVMGTVQA